MAKLLDQIGKISKKVQDNPITTTKTIIESGKPKTTTYLKSGTVTLKTTTERVRKGTPKVVWIG